MTDISEKYTEIYEQIEFPSRNIEDKEKRRELLREYREKQQIVIENFRNALICACDVKDNPKAKMCFDLAWEYGHAYGFREVERYFAELVELIR